MRDLISEGDLAYIQSQYPDKSIRMPSIRNQQIIMMYLRGMTNPAIAQALGEPNHSGIGSYINSPSCQAIVDFLRANEFNDVRASREYLTDLLFQSYHKAGSVTEEVMAIREIGKLNGLYKSDEQRTNNPTVQINHTTINNVKQLEKMTEAQLVEIVQAAPIEAPKLPAYQPEENPPSEESL